MGYKEGKRRMEENVSKDGGLKQAAARDARLRRGDRRSDDARLRRGDRRADLSADFCECENESPRSK